MNSSLYSLDRATHLKIVIIAAMAAAIVFAVGESARLHRQTPTVSAPAVSAPTVSAPELHRLVRPATPMPDKPSVRAPKPKVLVIEAA